MKIVGRFITIGILLIFIAGSFGHAFGEKINEKNNIVLDFNFSNPIVEEYFFNEKSYDFIKVQGLPNTNDLGIPRLPVKSVRILLPQGKDIKDIKVLTDVEENIGNSYRLKTGGRLIPLILTNDLEINHESKTDPITKNYNTPLFENKGVYCCRGFNILHVNLYPVQYSTNSGEISFYNNMKLVVETKPSLTSKLFRGLDADFEIIENIIDNPNCLNTYENNIKSLREQYDYVVITNEDLKFSSGDYTFQDLLDYKEGLGFSTKIVTVEDIIYNPDYDAFGPWGDANPDNPFYESDITGNFEYFDNESARIRNFIRFAYTEWGTQFVLLGGDADVIVEEDNIIPLRGLFANESGLPLNGLRAEEEDDIPSDVYYACLDGNFNYDCDDHFGECADRNDAEDIDEADLYSEVSVGRACVDSEQELSNFVMKTLKYSTEGGEHYSKILFIGEYLGNLFYTPWGGDYKDLFEESIPSYYTLEKLYDKNDDWDPFELLTRLKDDPVQFINHDGHGNHNYILKLHSDNIASIQNEKHFFIYSHSCYTGSFDNKNCWYGYLEEDCIAEILTVEIEYGAYACILNSRFGLGSEDTIDSPSGAFDGSFLEALFVENIRELGPANHYSKEDNVWRIDENGMRWCYYQTNLFGDPQLMIKNPNEPPRKPTIIGPTKVKVGETHNYTISTTDPDGDDILYFIDNGDGTGEWTGPYPSGQDIQISKTFKYKGTVTIRAKAKDIKGAESEFTELKIQVPRGKYVINHNLYQLLSLLNRLRTVFSPYNLS